ncbi:MAG: hypothetical protein WAL50_16685, partial [Kineosporiaceae bacterium]
AAVLTLGPAAGATTPTQPQDLGHLATSVVGQLDTALQQWSTTLLATARNPKVLDAYRQPGQRAALQPAIDAFLTSTYRAQPVLTTKLSLVDADGAEIARGLKGVPAASRLLSPDETDRPYVGVALASADAVVHQHGPYVSLDAKAWVISRATPITLGGRAVGLVNAEADLEGLRGYLLDSVPDTARVRIIDTTTDTVLIDSATPVPAPSLSGDLTTQWLPRVVPLERLLGETGQPVHRQDLRYGWRVEVAAVAPASATAGTAPWTLIGLLVVSGALAVLLVRRVTAAPARRRDSVPAPIEQPAAGLVDEFEAMSAGTAPRIPAQHSAESSAPAPERDRADETEEAEEAAQTDQPDQPETAEGPAPTPAPGSSVATKTVSPAPPKPRGGRGGRQGPTR